MRDERFTSTRASYDRIVEDYERQTSSPPPAVVSFREGFLGRQPEGARIADLGCGPGRDLAHFRTCGVLAVGVDASVEMVRRVGERGLPAVVDDLRRPPLRLGAWSGIWASASLLHVPHSDVAATLAAWHDLLMPGGAVALTTSIGADEAGWEDVPYAAGTQERNIPLRRWFQHHDRQGLENVLLQAGFVIAEAEVRDSHRVWLQLLAVKAD